MGWSIGYDSNWQRDIGYGVPAECDHPDCHERIDRGLGYVCGGEPYGGEHGCGLFFCGKHQVGKHQRCACCSNKKKRRKGITFEPKPNLSIWLRWKLRDVSWYEWRKENPEEVAKIRNELYERAKEVKPILQQYATELGITFREMSLRMIEMQHKSISF